MTTYVLQRLAGLIPVLFGISLVVFLLMQLIPGDVAQAMLGLTAKPEDVARLREALGLNEPIYVQYARWLNQVLHGDFGISLQQRTEVLPFVLQRFRRAREELAYVLQALGPAGPLGAEVLLVSDGGNEVPEELVHGGVARPGAQALDERDEGAQRVAAGGTKSRKERRVASRGQQRDARGRRPRA